MEGSTQNSSEVNLENGKKQTRIYRKFSKKKLWIWRLIAFFCIIPGWIITFAPILPLLFSESFPKYNISQNQMLLDKLNLSNVTVLCPEGYTFSPIEQRCTTVCGYYDNYPLPLTISKRVLLSAIAVINTGVTILAIYRLIRYRKEFKFQHHPIFIGVFVNLLQSIVGGIPDILGANIFFCEGRQIDYATLNANPTIQVHIHGALMITLSISNRLWFVMALVLILLATFPLRSIFKRNRNRIITVVAEICVCVVYPAVCGLAPFVPFSGYALSDTIMLPVSVSKIVGAVFGYLTQLTISGLTLTIVVLIIYRIHSQIQMGSARTGKRVGIQPIEKRLIFFNIVYFVLNAVITITLASLLIFKNIIEKNSNDYASYLTLNSPYSPNTMNPFELNTTLSLLSPEDQLLVEPRHPFFIIFIHDIGIRSLFIIVLSVLNFSCSNNKFCLKKNKKEDAIVVVTLPKARKSIDF